MLLLVTLEEVLAFIEISLCAHLPLVSTGTACNGSLAIGSCCWSATIWCTCLIAEIVKIIEHQVHVFLLVLL